MQVHSNFTAIQFNKAGTRTSSSCLAKRLSGCCSSAAAVAAVATVAAAEVGAEEAAGDCAAAEDSELTLPLH